MKWLEFAARLLLKLESFENGRLNPSPMVHFDTAQMRSFDVWNVRQEGQKQPTNQHMNK